MWRLKGKKILVVGLGRSGIAAAHFLLDRGACVSVTDRRSEQELARTLSQLGSGLAGVHLGGHPPSLFRVVEGIVLSPGVPSTIPGLKEARRAGVPILGEFGLAAEFLGLPLVAVTGTNGKSTTATLIARMIEDSGRRVALAGNIGRPLLEVVMERERYDWVVAEVSSFQLETVRRFHPRAAVVLNITPDHLDRYRSFADYSKAKFRIFAEQSSRDLLVTNADDPVLVRRVRSLRRPVRRLPFSSRGELPVGLFLSAGEILYRPGRGLRGSPRGLEENYPLSLSRLVGRHNAENVMASIGVARFCGVSPDSVRKSLERFEGLPHRMERVREHRGVTYYNDSKGTNVDAVVQSLASLPEGRVLLVAGGYDKGGSYRPLRSPVRSKVKLLILIGAATPKIRRALEGCTEIIEAGELARAVPLAASRAVSGDVVLLSPACASYDQFRDFEERGELFRRLVKDL